MKQIVYNAQTKEATLIDVPDIVEQPMTPQEPTEAERLDALEDAMLFII